MRQIALGVGDLVDVEEDGAGNMLLEIFGARVLASPGMCQEASMMTMSGASSSAASSSVSVNQDLERSVISNPNLDEDGRCRSFAAIEPGGNRQPLLTQECRVE